MQLRDYQERVLRAVPGLLLTKRRVVLVGPTGSGKTVVGAGVIRELLGKRVLWLAHRWELIDQARNELISSGVPEEWIRVFTGTEKSGDDDALVTVASVDMFRAHPAPVADLIVVDEAHRTAAASYQRIIEARPDAMVLGLTATPWRLDGQGLGDTYAHMLVMAGPTELIADGFIACPVTYGVPKKKARAMLRGVRSGKRDYATEHLARAMMKRKLMGDVVKECARLSPGAPTLVFAVNRKHGQALASRFARSGRPTRYLDGETPKAERSAMIEALRSGEIEVIVNVDVLSEGFDCPPVKCIALARPTKSLTRFLQQIGRASRPYKGRRPVILDHAGNCWRFGLPHAEREWSLDGRPVSARSGDAPVKICRECEAVIHAGSRMCPECGAEITDEREIAEDAARLQRISLERDDLARRECLLRGIAQRKRLPERWVQVAMAVFS